VCGIFGVVANTSLRSTHLYKLARHARQRGRDSSGLMYANGGSYQVKRADYDIKRLLDSQCNLVTSCVIGHSRLITNGLSDN